MKKIKFLHFTLTLLAPFLFLIFIISGSLTSDFLSGKNDSTGQKNYSTSYLTDTFRCATTEYNIKMIEQDKDYENRLRELEKFTQNYIKNLKPGKRNVVKIPVVVHIVYNTPEQNISNAEVQSQIDVLNIDYRRMNADTVNTPQPFKHLGADTQIEFVLAKRDPMGNPTIGITRTQTPVTVFDLSGYVKFDSTGGHDIWDRDKYLNFWVCNFYFTGGYSQYPGGNPATDGIVMHHAVFGTIRGLVSNFKLGRVATHEVGHWFYLIHIFGNSYCGNDSVDDTPTQYTLNLDCPSFPHITCNNGPNGDMFTNYMDGTFDICKNIFTIGQSNRMNAALYGARAGLLTSNGATPVSGIPIAHFRSNKMTINYGESINFFDESGGIPTSRQWTFEGGNPAVSNQQNPVIMYPNGGYYPVKLRVMNSYGTDSVTYENYIKVFGASMNPFSTVYPPSNTIIHTTTADTAINKFTWERTSNHSSIIYKWKIRKAGTFTDYSYSSNNNGTDTVITIRNSFLDSLAMIFEPGNDTARCVWRAVAYNGTDSLTSTAKYVYLVRNTIGIIIVSSSVPDKFNLFQNYPNPFNSMTNVKWKMLNADVAKIIMYDLLGKEVTTLINEKLQPGTYEITYDAGNLTSGIYFYKLITGEFSETKRMVLLK